MLYPMARATQLITHMAILLDKCKANALINDHSEE